jgi:hypothetical protein
MLNGDELGTLLWKMLKDTDSEKPQEFWQKFGKILVEYIKKNSEVKTDVTTNTGKGTGVGKIE